jgi:gliding motility-associated-like protein
MAEDFPGGFKEVNLLPGNSNGFTLDSVDTENSLPILRIAAFDACQNKSVYSDTLSVVKMSGVAENNRNRISWEVYPINFDQYEIFRDQVSIGVIASPNQREYIDEEVVCFTEYCYSLVYTSRNGGKSYSDTVCVEAVKIYFPPPIRNTTVSVTDSLSELSWSPPETVIPEAYFIQKLIEENVYATLDTVDVNHYLDSDSDPGAGSVCYRISYLDECRNRSNLGDLACSVFLLLEDNRILSWNDYTGWQNGVKQYVIEVYDEDGKLQEEINMGTSNYYEIPDFLKLQLVQYRVRAESNDEPSLVLFSNWAIKRIESVIWMPNAFTPDGDGLNDFFKPEGTLMQEFNMKIYNREGNLLFETEDQESGWDGRYDGDEMPLNTYIYRIEAVDNEGKSFRKTGKLLLIRE